MDSTELSLKTRWGMALTGLIQGGICYLLMTYLVPIHDSWLFFGLPATLAISLTLLLTVVSFKQRALWGWLAVIAFVVLALSWWQKYNAEGMDRWQQYEMLFLFGCRLLFMALLALPWLQYRLHEGKGIPSYSYFYNQLWHNALTVFVFIVLQGLVWLVLLLWSSLFRLVGIYFFKTLFFDSEWFLYITTGLITALAVILARTQPRLITAIQKLLTLIATGLLPLVSVLALLFIVTLPFTGLEMISERISAAALLSTLALILLLLMAIVREPQKSSLPYPIALRCVIKASLLIAPVFVLLAGWALWLRIHPYGWTPERLYGALIVLVLLIWSVGYVASIVRRGCNPLLLQGKVILALSLFIFTILLLLSSPVLDVQRISVNSHMARYQSGKITADQVSLYMLQRNGRAGREALEKLAKDDTFTSDNKRAGQLTRILKNSDDDTFVVTAELLAKMVTIAPGSQTPDKEFWEGVMEYRYRVISCNKPNRCLIVSQDLNTDGKPEQVLFTFGDRELSSDVLVFGYEEHKWKLIETLMAPSGLTRDRLLKAVAENKVGAIPQVRQDLTVDGKRLKRSY